MSETQINLHGEVDNAVTLDEWEESWSKGHIAFHKSEVHPMLEKHIERLEAGRSAIKVFVPLCGKSVDMKWLYDRGHTVIGVEGVAQGITDFFDEQQLQYVTEQAEAVKGTVYKTADGRLRLYCCDFFEFNSSVEGTFDGIWDRGSLVAINTQDQNKYRDLIVAIMNPGTCYLLATFDFNPALYGGPPHYVSEEEIAELFGGQKVEKIDYHNVMMERHRTEWGLDSYFEKVHLITSSK